MGKLKTFFEKKSRRIIGGVLVVAIIGGVVVTNMNKPSANDATATETTYTEPITRMNLTKSIGTSGTIQSKTTKNLSTDITKTMVKSVNVSVGDYVNVGDVIAVFDDADIIQSLSEAQANYTLAVKQAALNLTQSSQNLDSAKTNVTTSVKNAEDSVNEYAKKLADAKEDLEDAKKDYETYKLQYETALAKNPGFESEYEEYSNTVTTYTNYISAAESQLKVLNTQKENYDDGACSAMTSSTASSYPAKCQNIQSQIDSTQLQIDNYTLVLNQATAKVNANANMVAIKKNYDTAKSSVETLTDQVATYQKGYDSALRTLETTKNDVVNNVTSAEISLLQNQTSTSVEAAKTALEKAQDNYNDIEYKATVAGTITSINVTEGEIFESGNVAVVQDIDSLMVEAELSEYDIINVKVGQKVVVKTNATGTNEYAGVVTFVSLVPTSSSSAYSTSSSTTYTVRIEITNPDENFRLGMAAKLSIVVAEANNVLAVPYTAINEDESGNKYITVMDDAGNKSNVYVSVGQESDYYVEIQSDSDVEGKQVVISSTAYEDTSSAAADGDMMGGFYYGY